MKKVLFLFVAVLAFAFAANAQGLNIGAAMENFTLTDVNGKTQSLNDIKGKNGAVLIFVSSECPVVRGYNERMNQLTADYKAKGINVIGINSNATETLEQIRTHAAETYKFPVFIDKGSMIADKLGASVTPEAFYIDANNVLLYHGAIDNDRSGRNPTEQYLKTAFDSTLAGRKVQRSSANAFGCSIKKTVD